jgi:hypothetical protein
MLREMAAETPGVELMLGHTARGLLMDGRRVTGVETTGPAGERSLSARLVVAADGRGSRIAELAGVPGKRRPHGRYAYVVHYRDLPLTSGSRSQMWLLEPDCAYAFPHDDGITMLACMPAHERRAEFKRDPVAALERMFESLPSAPSLAGARRVSKAIGKIDMTNVSRPVARPGLAFVGDAAMVPDPLWGVGCGFASSPRSGWSIAPATPSSAARACTPACAATAAATAASSRPPLADERLRDRPAVQPARAADVVGGRRATPRAPRTSTRSARARSSSRSSWHRRRSRTPRP